MKQKLKQSPDSHFIPMTSVGAGKVKEVRNDVCYYTNQIVNVVFVGLPDQGDWFLIDAGMPGSGKKILSVARDRFGDRKPAAIFLTHGHFDHVGGIVPLLEEWKVPVYAHPLEFSFLSGTLNYPEPDTTVEGGMLAKLSSIYPHEATNIATVLKALPEDGTLPGMDGWRWMHTPGHSPGHVSFFRLHDRTLIAGDAFVTVRADSLYKVLLQRKEINGPPRYLTTDWKSAETSVFNLLALQPEVAITGHGAAMKGPELRDGLLLLADQFGKMAVPSHGKFVGNNGWV